MVILDFMMPGMTGADVARELRERDPGLPVIFASGYAEEGRLRELLGWDWPILHKPFRLGALAELVAEALRGSRA